ncbi:MAG: hypothetical protein O3C40_08050 [Planctomycetota bacterium]|nr:hypothetical protein [Planctomycetota bacterium]
MHAIPESIQHAIRDFRSESSEWENEVLELFNYVDRFLATDGRAGGGAGTATVAQDVAGLKGLVEQQTEVLTALVNALTGQSAVADAVSEGADRTNDQAAPEVDPFERLQQAVAAASGAS